MPKRGHPTDYRPEFTAQAEAMCLSGATDAEIAHALGVSTRTIYRWQAAHPEFCQAIKTGKEPADDRVERSLYHRAVGYSFEAERIVTVGGKTEKVKYTEHVPPDTASMIFWLKNRRKDNWRDIQQYEHGRPGEFDNLTDEQLVARLQDITPGLTGSTPDKPRVSAKGKQKALHGKPVRVLQGSVATSRS